MPNQPGIIERPTTDSSRGGTKTEGWIVTVFNNEVNTYEEVIAILMIATRCSLDEAAIETWEIDHLGRSVVHYGGEEECNDVCKVISTIGIRVQVSQE